MEVESKRIEKYVPPNMNHKSTGVTMLISDKIDFKTGNIIIDKEGLFIRPQEHTKIMNVYIPENILKTHEAKPNRLEKRDIQFNDNESVQSLSRV